MASTHVPRRVDVLVIGAGIIGSTTSSLLAELEPQWDILVVEALGAAGLESSHGWNNAGTGHAGLCEFNYTPAAADGSVDPAAALRIHEQFLVSAQYWARLAADGQLGEPEGFIRSVDHNSYAHTADWASYLETRYRALSAHPLFEHMEFSRDPETLKRWLPAMFEQRTDFSSIAATRSTLGTDVDYGTLSQGLLDHALAQGAAVQLGTSVRRLQHTAAGRWRAELSTGESLDAGFVFTAAGGGTLPLLQQAGIAETRNMGGFPISGQFLRTANPRLVARHRAKAYSHPAPGAPPLSVPHLDLRVMDGTEYLVFGPFGAFSPRFLKAGKLWDLPGSVTVHNLRTLLEAAKNGTGMLRYFIGELLRTPASRLKELENFLPEVHAGDWELITAGQRVQLAKRIDGQGRIAGFGTEVVLSSDGTLAAVLGASPGASASVSVVLDLLAASFPQHFGRWLEALRGQLPHLGATLNDDPQALAHVRTQIARGLKLDW